MVLSSTSVGEFSSRPLDEESPSFAGAERALMAKTVFIFGAGASRHSGAPVMSEFYRKIVDIQEGHSNPAYQAQFDLVVKASRELDNVYAKMTMEYHQNVEELFATFEMAELLQKLGSLKANELAELPSAMRSVIAATIEGAMQYPYDRDQGMSAPHGYSSFADMLASVISSSPGDFALITFNYDYGLDLALQVAGIESDYCLTREPPAPTAIPLLKLHGSLNWGICPRCDQIVPLAIEQWMKSPETIRSLGPPPNGPSSASFFLSQSLAEVQHEPCGVALSPNPFIVPPTFNKTQYHHKIAPVWRRALLELSQARNIFVIGYSVPRTDQFFRHLFALSLAGGPWVNTLTIVNPSAEVYETFRGMAGQKLIGVLRHLQLNFEDSRAELRGALRSQGI